MLKMPSLGTRAAIALACLVCSWYYAFAVAPKGRAADKKAILKDFYPMWNGGREVLLHRSDPYADSVTRATQIAMYGRPLNAADVADGVNEQRFAYPVYATFLFIPLLVVPFWLAQQLAFAVFLAATAWSVYSWLGRDLRLAGIAILLSVGAYPTVVALQLRQPTLLYASILAMTVASLKNQRLVAGGVLFALATGKPQIAIAIFIPVMVWCLARWPIRKSFLLSFLATEAALWTLAFAFVPDWIPHWVSTLRLYSADATPLAVGLAGTAAGLVAGVMGLAVVTAVSWKYADRNLLFAASFSIAVFQFLIPYQIYNSVLLFAPFCWIAQNRHLSEKENWSRLLMDAVWIALGMLFLITAVLSLIAAASPAVAAGAHTVPLGVSLIIPIVTLLAFSALALSWSVDDQPGRLSPAREVPQG